MIDAVIRTYAATRYTGVAGTGWVFPASNNRWLVEHSTIQRPALRCVCTFATREEAEARAEQLAVGPGEVAA